MMQRLKAAGAKPSHHPRYCAALCCCGSRSSSSPLSSSSAVPTNHAERAIVESSADTVQRRQRRSTLVVLLAVDRSSYDPRTDFRESILEVIVSRGLQEPEELRSLLNCYISLNSREHRRVILEAFHEVCCRLFLCNNKNR